MVHVRYEGSLWQRVFIAKQGRFVHVMSYEEFEKQTFSDELKKQLKEGKALDTISTNTVPEQNVLDVVNLLIYF